MTPAEMGYAVGMFLAAGGLGYIFLGFLWAIRVYKRWPRGSTIAASVFVLLVGFVTAAAATGSEVWIASVATVAAAAFIVWRGPVFKTVQN